MGVEELINDLGYSEKMYIPESIMMGWFNLSAIITATSLIFYNMARKSAIKFDPFLSKAIAIGLILMSTFYMIYSLLPYYEDFFVFTTTSIICCYVFHWNNNKSYEYIST